MFNFIFVVGFKDFRKNRKGFMKNYFYLAFHKNKWLYAHLILAMVLLILTQKITGSNEIGYAVTICVAVLWEVFEAFYEADFKLKNIVPSMQSIYGSKKNWLYDASGDILAAMLVVLFQALTMT